MSKPDGKDIGVTVDGTWQRRGFSSLNGIVAAIAVKGTPPPPPRQTLPEILQFQRKRKLTLSGAKFNADSESGLIFSGS